jgi:hypothetical protein
MGTRVKKSLKIVLPGLAGAAIGFGYYSLIGCEQGGCPITSSPYISTLYGGVSGFIIGLSGRKRD